MRVLRNKSWQVLELRAEDGVLPQHIHSSSVSHPEHDVAAGTHTHWSPTPELGQLLPGSVSLLLAELMCTGVTQMMFIWRGFSSSHQLAGAGVQSSLVRQPLLREGVCWTPQEFSPSKNCRTRIATWQWNNLHHHCEIYDPDIFERCPYDV